jgi:hypothetical protein
LENPYADRPKFGRSGISFSREALAKSGPQMISLSSVRTLGTDLRRVQDFLERGFGKTKVWIDFSQENGREHEIEVYQFPVYCRVKDIDGKESVRVEFKNREGDLTVEYSQNSVDTDPNKQTTVNPKFILVGVVGDTLELKLTTFATCRCTLAVSFPTIKRKKTRKLAPRFSIVKDQSFNIDCMDTVYPEETAMGITEDEKWKLFHGMLKELNQYYRRH